MSPKLALPILVLTSLAHPASADVVLYGPTPYLGSFDSPFFSGIQNGSIYLEDFEDGELDTPFVLANDIDEDPSNGWRMITVHTRNPLAIANSVDEDDGLNGDFIGSGGDALTVTPIFGPNAFEFRFLPDASGHYPRYVGFVVTEPEDFTDEDVVVTMLDPGGLDGQTIRDQDEFDPNLWDPDFNGDTRAHRFIGAFSSTGIEFLRIEGVDELDHLQYGYAIPEPYAGLLATLSVALLALRRRRGGGS